MSGDNKSTRLYVNGELYESLDIRTRIYEGATRLTYQVRTLAFPLEKAGTFRSKVHNLKVHKD